MQKYILTDVSKEVFGVRLFQIKAIISFGSINKGELGGFIEKEENLSKEGNAWVSGDAWVYDNARVSGNAWVYGNARVSGNAQVSGDAWVYDNARVSGNAWVSGNAQISGNAQVSGDAWVYGNARVSAKSNFTRGWFIGGDDTEKITNITNQTGSGYWKAQYVLGDYEINPIEQEKSSNPKEITIDGATCVLKESMKEVNIQKYAEVVDEDGEPIAGIVAFQVYKDALIIATKDKMYTNNPSLFPGAKGIKAITLN